MVVARILRCLIKHLVYNLDTTITNRRFPLLKVMLFLLIPVCFTNKSVISASAVSVTEPRDESKFLSENFPCSLLRAMAHGIIAVSFFTAGRPFCKTVRLHF